MNLQEIQSIRDELLNRVTEALGGQQGSDNAQGAEPAAARLPFAAGISVRNDKDLALEVRVDPGNTKALKEVEALKKKKPRLLVTIQNFFSSANAVELDPDPHPVLTRKAETLYPGLSIGHKEVRAGTLGAFVKCNDGKAGILTAGHVIGRIGIEDNWGWVYQPGLPDVRIMRARRRIGRVRDFPDLAVANINIIDAGIVEVQKSWVGRITNTIPSLGTPVDGVEIGGAALTIDELQNLGSRPKVWKVGRKTGYTEGRMTAFDVNGVTVDYGGVGYTFDDLIEVRWNSQHDPFSLKGDSGAVVSSKEGNRPIGVNFAGFSSEHRSYACLLAEVLKEFEVELWT